MAAQEHPAQVPSRDHWHQSALRLLGDYPASHATRLQHPSVIGIKPGRARVPAEFTKGLESPPGAAHARPKGPPFEDTARSQIRRAPPLGPVDEAKPRAVAVPLGPALRADEPSPDPLRRRRNFNFVARIYGNVLRLHSARPFHRIAPSPVTGAVSQGSWIPP